MEEIHFSGPVAAACKLWQKAAGVEGFSDIPLEELVVPEWQLSPEEEAAALEEIARVLEGCGVAEHPRYVAPGWATVLFVLDVPSDGYIARGEQVVAAHFCWLRFDEASETWRVWGFNQDPPELSGTYLTSPPIRD